MLADLGTWPDLAAASTTLVSVNRFGLWIAQGSGGVTVGAGSGPSVCWCFQTS